MPISRRLFTLGPLALLAASAPAGRVVSEAAPVLPEMRRPLSDGWACLNDDPRQAREHAMAVLMGRELNVEVDLRDVPSDRRTVCRAAVDGALEAWQDALGGEIRLRRLPEGERCGIAIRFQPDVREEGAPVAGYVNWLRETGRPVSGTVRIRTVRPDGSAMPGRAMRAVVLHEMGHLLGLDDTDRSDEAMGPLAVSDPVARPSRGEADAVRALRAEAERLLRNAR